MTSIIYLSEIDADRSAIVVSICATKAEAVAR
jgi:hypothetical protein